MFFLKSNTTQESIKRIVFAYKKPMSNLPNGRFKEELVKTDSFLCITEFTISLQSMLDSMWVSDFLLKQ